MRVVIGVSGGEAKPSGHSLRLLSSGGDPGVGTVVGGGLCACPRSMVTRVGLGSHSGPALHPEGGQELRPHPWHGRAGFPEGVPPWRPRLPHVPTEHAAAIWWPHPGIVQTTRGHFRGSLGMKRVQDPRHIGVRRGWRCNPEASSWELRCTRRLRACIGPVSVASKTRFGFRWDR